jgi:hypothetical protein
VANLVLSCRVEPRGSNLFCIIAFTALDLYNLSYSFWILFLQIKAMEAGNSGDKPKETGSPANGEKGPGERGPKDANTGSGVGAIVVLIIVVILAILAWVAYINQTKKQGGCVGCPK